MVSRAFTRDDYWRVKELHDKYYPEFEFPKLDDMLNAFVIEDEQGIIMAGGVEQVAEAALLRRELPVRQER